MTEEREVDAGQRLTPEGSTGYTFFVIEEGTADVFHEETFIRTMGPGDRFGELAILGDGRRTATVVSTSPMKVVAIFGTVYRQIEAEMPDVAKRIEEVVRTRS